MRSLLLNDFKKIEPYQNMSVGQMLLVITVRYEEMHGKGNLKSP